MSKKNVLLVLFLVFVLLSTMYLLYNPYYYKSNKVDISEVVMSVSDGDIMAGVFWNINDTKELQEIILREATDGVRDKFFLPINYAHRMNNSHFDDTRMTDEYQKDVYTLAKLLLRKMALKMRVSGKDMDVIDVGCGSGWKLVHLISPEFRTIGIETEPALSFLRKKYPEQVWFNSGKEDEALPAGERFGNCDMGISADVVEHIRDPDELLKFLKELNCQIYVISTPLREAMGVQSLGPPTNKNHVREWTFAEFQVYLHSHGFKVLRSFNGIQHTTTQFHVAAIN